MTRMQAQTYTQGSSHAPSLQDTIDRLGPWFHNIHLPDGTQTAPDHWLGDFPSFKWRDIAPCIPGDLDGWSVLDIGCNAGFYSIELAKRGAEVLAIDHDRCYLEQAAWAAKQFGLDAHITFEKMEVYELVRLDRKFDLVLFLGVLYHLRYPLLAIDLVADRVQRILVLQTLMMPGRDVAEVLDDLHFHDRERMHERGFPKMAFIERTLTGDPTNWWVPNHACIEAMLRSANLTVLARPLDETYICEPAPGRRVTSRALPVIRTEDPR
jgi:tRNA (mo5U34)-methyltransferase